MSLLLTRTSSAIAALGVAALLLTGCGAAAEPTPSQTGGAGTPTTAPTAAEPEPSADPIATAAAATCESIISADILADLGAQGWTSQENPFTAGGVTAADGILCTWADYDVASANSMLFGWAPLTADEATAMQNGLGSEGWLREIDGDSVYITEDPEQALTVDENGYGMTYRFGNGWVILADTKQYLLLVERPQ